jgi:hypothetical protein
MRYLHLKIKLGVCNYNHAFGLAGCRKHLWIIDRLLLELDFDLQQSTGGCLKSRRQPLFIRVPDGEVYAFINLDIV